MSTAKSGAVVAFEAWWQKEFDGRMKGSKYIGRRAWLAAPASVPVEVLPDPDVPGLGEIWVDGLVIMDGMRWDEAEAIGARLREALAASEKGEGE